MFAKPEKPPDIPNSYRPISLLPYFSKICERLILKQLSSHLLEKNILPPAQFDFRAKHITIHQVHRVVDAISTSLEKKCYCTAAFLDISQAFDRVSEYGTRAFCSNFANFKVNKYESIGMYKRLRLYCVEQIGGNEVINHVYNHYIFLF